jgi:hypothetical protein
MVAQPEITKKLRIHPTTAKYRGRKQRDDFLLPSPSVEARLLVRLDLDISDPCDLDLRCALVGDLGGVLRMEEGGVWGWRV